MNTSPVNVVFAMGPRRPNPPDPRVVTGLQNLALNTLGPGATVKITSGEGEYGSPRHRGGLAADVSFLDQQGNLVTLNDPRLRSIALAAPEYGFRGFGAGQEYMGESSFHLDMFPHEQYTPDMAPTWGSFGRGIRDEFVSAIGGGPVNQAAPPQSNMPEPSERASTMNTAQPGMMPFAATDQQPFYRNPDFWDTLAIGLGGMSTRPNEAIIGAAQGRMQERRQDRRETEQRNQTLQWLASQGRDDLVAAVSAGLPITDAMNIALTPAPAPELSAAEQEIARFMEIGLTRDEAIRVSQLYTISRDPETGEAVVLNKLTGQQVQYNPLSQPDQITTTPLSSSSPEVEAVSGETVAPTSEFGEQYPNATSAFGLPGFARWGANVLTGTVGSPMFPSAQQSTAGFDVLRESLLNDIASAYERQPHKQLMEDIKALTPRAASPFVGVDQAVAQLDALGNNFLTELSSLQSQAQQRLSPTNRAEINQRIQAVQTGLTRIREARSPLLQGQNPAQTDEDFEAMLDRYAQ